MDFKITLDQKDWDILQDIVLDALDIELTQKELEHLWENIPDGIKSQAAVCGLCDSVVKYNLSYFIQDEFIIPVRKKNFFEDYDLTQINGSEIIEFLNDQLDNNEDLCDVSVESPIEFVEQSVSKNKVPRYTLRFNAYYNNWSTHQLIKGNKLYIDKNKVEFWLEEPFEGDGSSEELEIVLTDWIKTHKFSNNQEESFHSIVTPVIESLIKVGFSDKEELQVIIDQLIKAKTLMK